jgi:endonuclease G, mitochondrial
MMSNNKFLKVCFAFLLLLICISSFSQIKGTSKIEIPQTKKSEKILCHKHYCFVYDETHEHSRWVAYTLTKDMTLGNEQRKDKFLPDPLVLSGTAEDSDYIGTGYDRGHLAPAADMSFCSTALAESFYFSNISPQNPGFNRGMWKKLENEVRNYAISLGKIYVVTGPILKTGLQTIGENKVSIPEKYYKAILYVSDTTCNGIAFIMKNEKINNGSLYPYAVSIDFLEKESGIDFFPELPRMVEKRIEKKCDTVFWKQFGN